MWKRYSILMVNFIEPKLLKHEFYEAETTRNVIHAVIIIIQTKRLHHVVWHLADIISKSNIRNTALLNRKHQFTKPILLVYLNKKIKIDMGLLNRLGQNYNK